MGAEHGKEPTPARPAGEKPHALILIALDLFGRAERGELWSVVAMAAIAGHGDEFVPEVQRALDALAAGMNKKVLIELGVLGEHDAANAG